MQPYLSWLKAPPCHGGDRRFESGRLRQMKIRPRGGFLFLKTGLLKKGGEGRKELLIGDILHIKIIRHTHADKRGVVGANVGKRF